MNRGHKSIICFDIVSVRYSHFSNSKYWVASTYTYMHCTQTHTHSNVENAWKQFKFYGCMFLEIHYLLDDSEPFWLNNLAFFYSHLTSKLNANNNKLNSLYNEIYWQEYHDHNTYQCTPLTIQTPHIAIIYA